MHTPKEQRRSEKKAELCREEYMKFRIDLINMLDQQSSSVKKKALERFVGKIDELINKPSPPSLYETIANWKQSKDLEEDIEALKRIDPSSNPLMKYLIQPIQRFLQLFFNFANPKTWQIFEAVTPEFSLQSARNASIQKIEEFSKTSTYGLLSGLGHEQQQVDLEDVPEVDTVAEDYLGEVNLEGTPRNPPYMGPEPKQEKQPNSNSAHASSAPGNPGNLGAEELKQGPEPRYQI